MEPEMLGVLVPQPHGGAIRIGGGRPPSSIGEAIRDARRECRNSLRVLKEIRDDTEKDDEARIKAALAIFTISGLAKERPKRAKRATFSVIRAGKDEQLSKAGSRSPNPEARKDDPESRGPTSESGQEVSRP